MAIDPSELIGVTPFRRALADGVRSQGLVIGLILVYVAGTCLLAWLIWLLAGRLISDD